MESFGWVISRVLRSEREATGENAYRQYLDSLPLPLRDADRGNICFLRSRLNAGLFDDEFKDAILRRLREVFPEYDFDAKELFWVREKGSTPIEAGNDAVKHRSPHRGPVNS
jgi:hypothetical protein